MTRSMHLASADLGLEKLWAVYPGKERYTLHARTEALPLIQIAAVCNELV